MANVATGWVDIRLNMPKFKSDLSKAQSMFRATMNSMAKMNRLNIGGGVRGRGASAGGMGMGRGGGKPPGFRGQVFNSGMIGGGLRSLGILSAGAGVAGAIKMFGNFEEKLVDIRANARLLGDAGEEAFGQIESAVRRAAKSSRFNPTETADAMNQLILGGLDAAQATEALNGTLDTAIATGMNLAKTAQVIVDNVQIYNDVTTRTASIVGDYLVSSQTMAQHTAEDLSAALNSAGSMAASMGVTLKESVAMLTAFAKGGQRGAKAGTAFRRVLARLASPTKQGEEILEKLNIQLDKFFDSNSNITDFVGLMTELAVKLEDAGDAFTLFGDRASAILAPLKVIRDTMRGDGTSFLTDAMKQLGEDKGRAAEIAAAKTKTFIGRVLELVSALQELAISVLKPLTESMVGFVTMITESVRWISTLNDESGGLVSTVVGGVAGFLVFAGAISAVVFAVTQLLNPIVAIGAAVSGFIAYMIHMYGVMDPTKFDEMRTSFWETIEGFKQGGQNLKDWFDSNFSGDRGLLYGVTVGFGKALREFLDWTSIMTTNWDKTMKYFSLVGQEWYQSFVNGLTKIVVEMWAMGSGIVDTFKDLGSMLANAFTSGFRTLFTEVSALLIETAHQVMAIWEGVKAMSFTASGEANQKAFKEAYEKYFLENPEYHEDKKSLDIQRAKAASESQMAWEKAKSAFTGDSFKRGQAETRDMFKGLLDEQAEKLGNIIGEKNKVRTEMENERNRNRNEKAEEERKAREHKIQQGWDKFFNEMENPEAPKFYTEKEFVGTLAGVAGLGEEFAFNPKLLPGKKGSSTMELDNSGGFLGIAELGKMVQEGILQADQRRREQQMAEDTKQIKDNTGKINDTYRNWDQNGIPVKDLAATLTGPGGQDNA